MVDEFAKLFELTIRELRLAGRRRLMMWRCFGERSR
jgi:hypothetical protein